MPILLIELSDNVGNTRCGKIISLNIILDLNEHVKNRDSNF